MVGGITDLDLVRQPNCHQCGPVAQQALKVEPAERIGVKRAVAVGAGHRGVWPGWAAQADQGQVVGRRRRRARGLGRVRGSLKNDQVDYRELLDEEGERRFLPRK